MIGIYKFTNKVNNKVYIGQSVNISNRYRAHIKSAFYPKSNTYNTIFHAAIRKYGIEQFDFTVLCTCSVEELNKLEKFYIQEYNSLAPNGYNMTTGGENPWGINFRYSKDDILAIIDDLRNTTKSAKELGQIWGCSDSLIKFISQGREYYIEGEQYPIRDSEAIVKITQEHRPQVNPVAVLNNEIVNDIIYDLLDNTLTFKEIAQKYSICIDQIHRINNGKIWKHIQRPIPCRLNARQLNEQKAKMTIKLLLTTDLSYQQIAEQVGYKYDECVARINKHQNYKEFSIDLPNPIRQ